MSVGHKALGDYRHLIGRTLVEEIQQLSEPLAGKRVLHLSATAMGGGVSEILYALVPLMREAGLETEWQIILGREEFFNVTKLLHNALQGNPHGLSEEDWEIFHQYNKLNAAELDGEYDYVIVHDPQPAAMRTYLPDAPGRWIWRCHIDLSTPNPDAIARMVPLVEPYDCKVFHLRDYVPPGVDGKVEILPPAIDPLAPKNMALAPEDAAYIVEQFGIDVEQPMLVQVSRFDPWKDPSGVIDAYRIVKEQHPGVQLALVGSMAHDDPEGWEFYNQTVEYAGDDPDIRILSNLNNVGAVEVNAFQVHARVCLQKSIKEGFGLTVSEALWKARPMIGGRVGGIVRQIEDGVTGYTVSSSEECAARVLDVMADPEAARAMARRGKEHVRTHFLTPRLVRDWLALMHRLDGEDVVLDVHGES